MPSRLTIYNGALTVHLGEPPLESLDDDVPTRYLLDGVWDREGLKRCLQQGQWNHAARTAAIEYEPSITPTVGYRHAFEKPSDYVRLMGIYSDQYLQSPLTRYTDEGGYWWADDETIYVRFVSDDNQYGGDLSLWPANYTAFVEAWFAEQICTPTTYADKKAGVSDDVKKLLGAALNTDALEQPAMSPPRGSWAGSRGQRHGNDMGSRGRLTG
jgi:hypothetical protein